MKKGGYVVVLIIAILLLIAIWMPSGFWGKVFGSLTGNVIYSESLQSGLLAYYTLDNTLKDYSGNNYDGVFVGGQYDPFSVSGVSGNAYRFISSGSFNGSNVIQTNLAKIYGEDNGLSISFWAKCSSNDSCTGYTLMKGYAWDDKSGDLQLNFDYNGVSSAIATGRYVWSSCGYSSSVSLKDNKWHNVVYVYSTSTGRKIYLDNVLVANCSSISFLEDTTNRFFIAGQDYSRGAYNKFTGSIDEVRVYNRVLSSSEISSLYNSISGNQTQSTCTDSDGGLNYYVKGNVTVGSCSENSCGGGFVQDGCIVGGDHDGWLREITCNSINQSQMNDYQCPNGCANGACVNSTNQTQPSNLICNGQVDNGQICVEVVQPNGGENLQAGTSYTIKWKQFNANYYIVLYELPNNTLVQISPSPGTNSDRNIKEMNYIWTVPSTLINKNLKIRVTVYDTTKNWLGGSDVSDNFFIVVNQTNQTQPSNATCIDSDGGLNYYVEGVINYTNEDGESFSSADVCNSEGFLVEGFCGPNTISYSCPNGCLNGACLTEAPQVCSSLINSVKNPISTEERRSDWNYSYSGTNWINNVPENYTHYGASWVWNAPEYQENQINYYYVQQEVEIYDNKNVNLSDQVNWNNNDPACKATSYWLNNKENYYYICNWNMFSNQQDLNNNYQSNNRQIFWYNDNVVVRMYLYWGNQLTDAQVQQLTQQKMSDLLNNMVNNNYQYVDWSNFDIPWPVSNELYNTLNTCESDVVFNWTTDQKSWSCKIEPVVCPPHGYQTRICTAWNSQTQKDEVQTTQLYCSPGICSGCYVPRWFESAGDNTCIPYGFRFKQQTGWEYSIQTYSSQDEITENPSGKNEFSISYIDADSAVIALGWNNVSYNVKVGDKVELDLTGLNEEQIISATMLVREIQYSSKENSTNKVIVEFDIVYNGRTASQVSAYCDIDGQIKQQKSKEYGNEWAKCENNYECESNICSSGECVDVKSMFDQVNTFKGTFVRVVCKLSNMFSLEEYNQCVFNYLGEVVPVENSTTPSTGGSGGGSS
jgi:hypothetical protein